MGMKLLTIFGNTIRGGHVTSTTIGCCYELWKDTQVWLDNCKWKEPDEVVGDCVVWSESELWVESDPFLVQGVWNASEIWDQSSNWCN
jgi:hypothetical protein